jgi:membrane associated rhomboid family serine protease
VILPLGDAPNPRGLPLATYLLMAANVAVYILLTLPLRSTAPHPNDPLLHEYVRTVLPSLPPEMSPEKFLRQVTAYDLLLFEYGFRPARPSVVALFAAMFLHAGFLHLFGNMLFLWIYGDNVEHRLGMIGYLATYVVTGIAATSFHAVFDSGSQLPLVGASGAISGVLGCYFLWFPRNHVRLFVGFFPIMMDTVFVPARLVLGAYLVFDNIVPFLGSRGGGGVAYGAHIGGFLAGLAIAWISNRRELSATPAEFAAADVAAGESAATRLQRATAEGRFDEAARLYFALPPASTRRVLPAGALLDLANWLETGGHAQAALVAYRRLLRDYPGDRQCAEAHLGAGRIQLRERELPAAYQHFLDALDAEPAPETALEARQAIEEITRRTRLRRAG